MNKEKQHHFLSALFAKFTLFLAIAYSVGAILHLFDILNLRLDFAAMDPLWKFWIVFLFVFDTLAAIGLFKKKLWGEILFLLIAVSQLVAYIQFKNIFGNQDFLVNFHIVCIVLYAILKSVNLGKNKWPAYSAK